MFDSATDALKSVLERRPLVVGFGEAHAQKGSESVRSASLRFTEQLLPLLASNTTDLVLELLVQQGQCGSTEQKVAKRQQPVTETQAEDNQGEFVALARRAKQLDVTPHVLSPSCEKYEAIEQAGDDAVLKLLELIAELTGSMVEALIEKRAAARTGKMIVTYGGAVHNDVAPREGRAAWSFGPQLSKFTQGRYVEIDLIVADYIKDNEVWRSLPWYEHFDSRRYPGKIVLFNPKPSAFVLIFPTGS